MTYVQSSAIEKLEYSRSKRVLVIHFQSGGVYAAEGVSRYRRDKVARDTDSVGKAYHRWIAGKFILTRLN